MTYILEIGDRRKVKAGIRVLSSAARSTAGARRWRRAWGAGGQIEVPRVARSRARVEPDLTAVHHRSVGRLVQSPPCVLMPGAVGHEHDHVVATSFGAVTCVRIVGVARAILVGRQILAVADGERSVACQDGCGREYDDEVSHDGFPFLSGRHSTDPECFPPRAVALDAPD